MAIEGIIFDLDGTLLDTIRDIAEAMNAVLRRHGHTAYATEDYKRMVGWGLRTLVDRAVGNRRLSEVERATLAAELRAEYHANPHVYTAPYPGIPEVLGELRRRRIPLGVLSNKAHSLCGVIVAATLGESLFETVRGQVDHRPSKPHPDGAHAVAESLGVSAGGTLFVGDSAVDMETAVNAGMTPIGVAWGFRDAEELREAGARTILETPVDLLTYIDRENQTGGDQYGS